MNMHYQLMVGTSCVCVEPYALMFRCVCAPFSHSFSFSLHLSLSLIAFSFPLETFVCVCVRAVQMMKTIDSL
jgi:hypothetical protein